MSQNDLISLKLKTKTGQFILNKDNNINLKTTLSELKTHISNITNINKNVIEIRFGFPPCVIKNDKDNELIENIGIKNGDTLIIEENKNMTEFNVAPMIVDDVEMDENGIVNTHHESSEQRHHIENNETNNKSGVLLKRTVPSDNSCLFTSIAFVLNGKVDTSAGSFMRQIIAESISNDKEQYCDAILGKPNEEYVQWIQKSDSWGGAIELAILSSVYGMEIAVIDSINQIINRFGEDQQYPHRVYLIFDGIHYDPLYWEPLDGSSRDIQTIFPTTNEEIYKQAERLAMEAKQSKQYTDVDKFTLKCLDCNKKLTGHLEATQHAKNTGHANFDECR